MIAKSGYCAHINGSENDGLPTTCFLEGLSLGVCEARCTSALNCIGYMYAPPESYHPSECYLIPSANNCPFEFDLLQESNTAQTINDLAPNYSDYNQYNCYGKNFV